MVKYLLIILAAFTLPGALMAQNKWAPKGILYSDKNLSVEIEYLLSPDGCADNAANSYFRYRITKIGPLRNYFINWRFDYFDCSNELKTQVNSLHITKASKIGIYHPELNTFKAKKMSNFFNDVKKSPDLPMVSAYKPVSSLSMEPVAINGDKDIVLGESTTLSVVGGSLGTGASWIWYENSCQGKVLGTGASITISPERKIRVFVAAIGPKSSACYATDIEVKQQSLAAEEILGRNEICEGEKNLTLSVKGGRLYGQAKWVWYTGSCDGEKIGEGQSIIISPQTTTKYFVRAEDGINKTSCVSFQLIVNNRSIRPGAIEGIQTVRYGSQTLLKVSGGYLAPGAQWVWFKGTGAQSQNVGTGTSLFTGNLYTSETFSVRAEGPCANTEFISRTVTVTGRPPQSTSSKQRKASFFINGGVVFAESSDIGKTGNFSATLGGGGRFGWFVKGKLSTKNNKPAFATSGSKIQDYNVPGYYIFNSQIISKRTAYTAGAFFGGNVLSVFLGAGYGNRELLWGVNQFAYDNSGNYAGSFAKNTANSFKGVEIDAGLMIRLGLLNLMGGVSSIQFNYTDFNIGIGVNL